MLLYRHKLKGDETMMNDGRDYDKIFKRLEYLWHGEILDRCCLNVKAPKDPKNPYIKKKPESKEELIRWYNDPEYILKRSLEEIDKTYFAGEALPMVFPYFGTGGHAKYLAPKEVIEYAPDTIWIHPFIDDLMDFNYDFDPLTNEVFKQECDIMSYLVKESKGRYFVGMPDNCGSYDALSQMRGAEDLLVDFLTEPEAVKYAGRKMVDILIKSGDVMFDIIKENCNGGSVHSWMNCVSKGKTMQMQCDLSVMISKENFDEYIEEELRTTANWLDNVIYHLDGQEQIRHLDTILDIDKINLIQWVQVDGQPPCTAFIPELKRIQDAGKGIVIGLNPKQAIEILDNMPPNGLNLCVYANSPEEADEFVRMASKY